MKAPSNTPLETIWPPILGISQSTKLIRAKIRTVAAYSSNVLITGPSGTGKELIARAIHLQSPRASEPFIPVDCAATTEPLFVAHIFGHVEGAFTGASHAELGCFRAADGGTIFLDEIGELDVDLQAKLLRVLQERTVIPVGSHKEIHVDVRVIAASNRDLRQEVAAGRFREDLYYRVNVVSLHTVPLKDRREDIAIFARHFLARLAVHGGLPLKRISDAALRRMRDYDWPGNVREMENVLERIALFTVADTIDSEAVSGAIAESETPIVPSASEAAPQVTSQESSPPDTTGPIARQESSVCPQPSKWPTMADVEREHLRRTLEFTSYNQSAAARLLEIDRHQLMRKVHKYGLDLSQSKRGRPPNH